MAPVPGTATAVPGTDDAPRPDPRRAEDTATSPPEPPSTKAARFTGVAPATTQGALFQSSPAIAYDLGNLVARTGTELESGNFVFVTPVQGWVRYPLAGTTLASTGKRFPVVVFLHGQHDPNVPNYQGYDYLARDLASQGYVAISIDANAINGDEGQGDASSQSRAQLVLGTLDRLREIDRRGGPGALDQLQGKLDFKRVGIMGHSRGGQGVSNALKFNLNRRGVSRSELAAALREMPEGFAAFPEVVAAAQPGVSPGLLTDALQKYNMFFADGSATTPLYDFRAALLLAPTDFSGNIGLVNVPLAVLLPTCDGDMSDLEGARTFDQNRFGPALDGAARHQIVVHGANHNFYNTVWTDDDNFEDEDAYCSARRQGGVRLSAQDQRRGGLFLVNSFMRYFVGGEQAFAAYWNATAQLPEAACPGGKGTCDERVVLTVQKDASRSRLIQRFDQGDSLRRNALDGALALSGFDEVAACSTPSGDIRSRAACVPGLLGGFQYGGWGRIGMLSIADQLQLSWTQPGAAITTDLRGVSAASYDSLTFRVAVVRPLGQEVVVTLTDGRGRSAAVDASDFSDALYSIPRPKGNGRPMADDPRDAIFTTDAVPQLLQMVAIPLAAFPGVDTRNLSQLKLGFPKQAGKAAVTDIQFQNLGRL